MVKLKQLLSNKIFQNAGWLVIGKVIQMVISLVVGILTARYLGPKGYGLISYASAYITFFSVFCTLGINSVLVKELVDHPKQEGMVLGTALGLRGISSLLSAIVMIGISMILDANDPLAQVVVALCSIGVLFNIFDVFNYWFQSKLESKKTAIAALVAYSVTAAYKIFLLATGKSVQWFALATSVDYICIAIILFWYYRRENGDKLAFSWRYGKQLLGNSCHFIFPGLMVAIYAQTDKIMLKHMLNEEEVGFYATATALCSMWTFILSAIIDSLTPVIMQSYKNDKEKYERYNKLLYCIVFYLSAFVSLAFIVGGNLAITILYGEAYLPAVAPLMVVTWYTAFSFLGSARNAWIVCEKKQKCLKYIYVLAAVVNVVLNLLLIPIWGTIGAAVASLISQVITVMVVPFFIKDIRKNSIMMLEAICFKGVLDKM